MTKIIELETSGEYPCSWDDLINLKGNTYATIYALEEARRDPEDSLYRTGITKGDDGIWDIIVDVPELTIDAVRHSLKDLSKKTGIEYKLNS